MAWMEANKSDYFFLVVAQSVFTIVCCLLIATMSHKLVIYLVIKKNS